MPQSRAGPSGSAATRVPSGASTTSRITSAMRKNACRTEPPGVGPSRRRRRGARCLQHADGAVETRSPHHQVVNGHDAVGMRSSAWRRTLGGGGGEAVEVERAGVAHRPGHDPPALAPAHQADADPGHGHLLSGHSKAGVVPGRRLIGHHQLVDRGVRAARPAGRAHATGIRAAASRKPSSDASQAACSGRVELGARRLARACGTQAGGQARADSLFDGNAHWDQIAVLAQDVRGQAEPRPGRSRSWSSP